MESAAATFVVIVRSDTVPLTRASGCGRFSTGIEQLPEAPSKLRIGRYCDGIAEALDVMPRVGRFSTGIEGSETPSILRTGSFADGYERIPRR